MRAGGWGHTFTPLPSHAEAQHAPLQRLLRFAHTFGQRGEDTADPPSLNYAVSARSFQFVVVNAPALDGEHRQLAAHPVSDFHLLGVFAQALRATMPPRLLGRLWTPSVEQGVAAQFLSPTFHCIAPREPPVDPTGDPHC